MELLCLSHLIFRLYPDYEESIYERPKLIYSVIAEFDKFL